MSFTIDDVSFNNKIARKAPIKTIIYVLYIYIYNYMNIYIYKIYICIYAHIIIYIYIQYTYIYGDVYQETHIHEYR
jgi:hypothetical protein